MDYLKFEAEDFLCEDSFLEYCLGTNPQAVAFWEEWLKDHPEKTDIIDSARTLFYTLNGHITAQNYQTDHEVFKTALATKLKAKVLPLKTMSGSVRRLWLGAGAAACLLFAAALFLLKAKSSKLPVNNTVLSYAAPLGKKRIVKLSDGSVLTLNGGSYLRLNKTFNTTNREVNLTGEAYFVVVHNPARPFIVHTSKITITDIGTEFDVKAYANDDKTEASLIKGKIEITINGQGKNASKQQGIILQPNKKFVFINNTLENNQEHHIVKQAYNIKNITTTENNSVAETDWTQNRLTFADEPLSEIAAQMERWYGVKVVITNPALNNIHFTATFDHGDIIQVLEALKISGNFNYRKEGNMISIY